MTNYKFIAKKIKEEIKHCRETTYTNLYRLISETCENTGEKMDSKSIQRRIYDVLNVFKALGIIHKDKKWIIYKGEIGNGVECEYSTENEGLDQKEKSECKSIIGDK